MTVHKAYNPQVQPEGCPITIGRGTPPQVDLQAKVHIPSGVSGTTLNVITKYTAHTIRLKTTE